MFPGVGMQFQRKQAEHFVFILKKHVNSGNLPNALHVAAGGRFSQNGSFGHEDCGFFFINQRKHKTTSHVCIRSNRIGSWFGDSS